MVKNNRSKWLMNEEYDGDVNKWKNQEFWRCKLAGKVDLYTSDLGFEKGFDGKYESQEKSHI